jgi:hypothetical protein
MTDNETDTATAAELRSATAAVARHLREISVILEHLSAAERAAGSRNYVPAWRGCATATHASCAT